MLAKIPSHVLNIRLPPSVYELICSPNSHAFLYTLLCLLCEVKLGWSTAQKVIATSFKVMAHALQILSKDGVLSLGRKFVFILGQAWFTQSATIVGINYGAAARYCCCYKCKLCCFVFNERLSTHISKHLK